MPATAPQRPVQDAARSCSVIARVNSRDAFRRRHAVEVNRHRQRGRLSSNPQSPARTPAPTPSAPRQDSEIVSVADAGDTERGATPSIASSDRGRPSRFALIASCGRKGAASASGFVRVGPAFCPRRPRQGTARRGVFRWINDVDSALELSRLYHAACTLSVYASQPGSPPDGFRLVANLDRSGLSPARIEGFQHLSLYMFPLHQASPGAVIRRFRPRKCASHVMSDYAALIRPTIRPA